MVWGLRMIPSTDNWTTLGNGRCGGKLHHREPAIFLAGRPASWHGNMMILRPAYPRRGGFLICRRTVVFLETCSAVTTILSQVGATRLLLETSPPLFQTPPSRSAIRPSAVRCESVEQGPGVFQFGHPAVATVTPSPACGIQADNEIVYVLRAGDADMNPMSVFDVVSEDGAHQLRSPPALA